MWINNDLYLEDLKEIISDNNINWNKFQNKTFLVSGATGLIGNLIVNTLLYLNKVKNLKIKVIALVRNEEKANKIFEEQLKENLNLEFLFTDICNELKIDKGIDYIIHSASQTSSKMFVDMPVETIDVILKGTKNMLEIAKNNKVKDFIFLSTMEVYGRPITNEKIYENNGTSLSSINVRDCYPLAKLMAENLCVCYAKEFNFNTKILRLTQTFGPGVDYNDQRVFAEFARCVIENKDIILHTLGDTERNYLYTADAVRAIYTVLLKGKNSEIYNVSNEETYCSILKMAELVATECADNKINVKIETEENIEKFGYAPTLKMNLSSEKLKTLDWNCNHNLKNMYNRLIKSLRK